MICYLSQLKHLRWLLGVMNAYVGGVELTKTTTKVDKV